MAELPKVLYPCPRWRVHDDDPQDAVCPVCNGRGVVMQGGLPVPDDVDLTLVSFEPVGMKALEENKPVTITIHPRGDDAVDVKCPHCQKVNKVAGFVPRDPDKPNSQGREVELLYCGWCGEKFTPPTTKKE